MLSRKNKKITNQKIISYICLISIFSNNIYAIPPKNSNKKEDVIEFIEEGPESCSTTGNILLQNSPWANITEKYETPTKSKLMLQDPEMSDEFKKFIYKELCPQPIKELIAGYKKLGPAAFSKRFANLMPRVVVLHGPNGTGKSTLGILIAKKLKIKLIFINSGFLGTMYKQSEEVNLSEEIAPLLDSGDPCVIVIDEADALIGKNDKDDNVNRNKSAAIAQMMDMLNKKPNFILVWTTNSIDQIDAKFKDRSGVCKRIEVELPNQNQREKIIKYLIKGQQESSNDNIKIVCDKSFNNFSNIAKKTAGFSIRSLEELLKESFLTALIRSPKKTNKNNTVNNNTPVTVVLTEDDFNNTRIKIQNGISKDKNATTTKSTLKTIKEFGLIGCAITIAGAAISGCISYLLSNASLEQAKIAHKESLFISKESFAISKESLELSKNNLSWTKIAIISTAILAVISLIIAIKKKNKKVLKPLKTFRKLYA